jgi:hypothetical protein
MTPDNLYNPADNTPSTEAMDLQPWHLEREIFSRQIQACFLMLAEGGEERLDTADSAVLQQFAKPLSKSDLAWQRGNDLVLLAKHRAPEALRPITMAVAALFSSIVVGGSAMQALEGRSALAVGVGGVAAGGAAVAANLGAARYLKHCTMRHHTQQFLAQLEG